MLQSGAVWAVGVVPQAEPAGLVAAMLRSDGASVLGFGRQGFRVWSGAECAVLRAAAPAAAEVVETAAAELLSGFPEAEIVGFRGPRLAGSEAGSGAVLAAVLGCPVVSDFRSSDRHLGGLGGPLTPFFHHALARFIGARAPLAFLTLGAHAALSWVDPAEPGPEVPGACVAFDAGPAAPVGPSTGAPNLKAVARMLAAPYFLRMPPKALGPADAAALAQALGRRATLATRVEATAASVARGFEHFPQAPTRLLLAGAGRANPALMARLAALLPSAVETVDAAGLPGGALAAAACAHLALRVARGLPTSGPRTTGVAALVGGGQIDRP
ncbi:MAG: anhydro-N-acetylmuramic acid kinase [Phaeovulum sp.]|uniref:anhydro-N-acetylmuramic acid kinase n=1 Tax=Phaeovulum sp. TaxID=2934796 RepID=UPI00272FEB77|nr:anhydro-N-acetylmuramic acid kinase [Phaeovulum sp.]MDP2061855.1 anhydro-N-acetylmuramic acid kinase [Phaeovulum sp.]